MKHPIFKTGIGQDSHRFDEKNKGSCVVAGIVFEDTPPLDADSDGDVAFHAICNAITSITHEPILGKIAIDLCHKKNIKDSRIYLEKALLSVGNHEIVNVALSIEGKRPMFQKKSREMRQSIADVLKINIDQVGMTFTTGDALTSFGRGEGLQCFCTITMMKPAQ